MNIAVYLPDDIGKRAKAEGINISLFLRNALIAEFEKRDTVRSTTAILAKPVSVERARKWH